MSAYSFLDSFQFHLENQVYSCGMKIYSTYLTYLHKKSALFLLSVLYLCLWLSYFSSTSLINQYYYAIALFFHFKMKRATVPSYLQINFIFPLNIDETALRLLQEPWYVGLPFKWYSFSPQLRAESRDIMCGSHKNGVLHLFAHLHC